MFDKILIANRGEIAVRVARTARRMGIRTVAVYSGIDADALHVQCCDEAYYIGAAPALSSYLATGAILEAARASGAQAIHPGYGFLAESAGFVEACVAAGLVFIGPPAVPMRTLGLKSSARQLAARCDLPVVPGYDGEDQSPECLRREAHRLGTPLLIKPVAGGGGKGIRLIDAGTDFLTALAGARREALAAFGDERVLLEKFIAPARHVEVQVFADQHGHCLHLYDRDCSVQRRQQKLLEEAPAPAVEPPCATAMRAAAVALARAAGYVGAGTVEFLLDSAGRFYFMEMNTRLQVEHPVTEMITGLDLVEWQLRVAAGESLPLSQGDIVTHGHAIEVRLCAEDPAQEFLPATGVLRVWSLPVSSRAARVDTAARRGDVVSPYYDSLLAKLIVHADNRAAALRQMQHALRECRIAGITTNLSFLQRLSANATLAAGAIDTHFIDEQRSDLFAPPDPAPREVWLVAVLVLVLRQQAASVARGTSPWNHARAWRAGSAALQSLRLRSAGVEQTILVQFLTTGYRLQLAGQDSLASAHAPDVAKDDSAVAQQVTIDGHTIRAEVALLVGNLHVFLAGRHDEFELIDVLTHQHETVMSERGLRAPMPGRVIAVLVQPGEAVRRGTALIVMEAMKMEHTVVAGSDGRVDAVHTAVGAQVDAGDKLIELSPAVSA